MVEDVARVKKACPDCDRLQHRPGGTSGRPKAASPLDMQPLPHFGMFYRWHLDLAGPFEATRSRNVWMLVMVEAASKWVELVPLRTKEAANMRQAFQERVLARFAAPGEVCTDGGTEFSGEFQELLVHDIDHPKPLHYHPQPNGLAEGMTRALFEESAVDFNSPEGMWELMTMRAERLALMVPTAMHNVEAAQHREVMRYRRRRAGLVAPGVQRFSPGDFVYVQQRQQGALDPRVRPAVYKVYEVNDNGVVVIQGADGDTARVRVEELARCAVPYVVLPAGFEDPNMACEECDGRVSTQRSPIIICEDLINNNFNPMYQTEMCEDALESFVYHCRSIFHIRVRMKNGTAKPFRPVDALESAEGGFALGDLWAALDELEEDLLIEEVVEGLLNDVDASNQEGEECDNENAYAYSSSEAEDSGDDEDELYFSPLPTRNPRRDTLYGHAYFVDDATSDDEMEPRRGKGSSGRLWAGHEKATSEHTFETWKNSTDCAMQKEQQHAFDRNRPFNEIHEVHVLRSRIQPKYSESLETTLISRGIKYEDSRIVRRLEGAERLDYYRRLLDGMWEELVNITKQIELHSERYNKCHRSPGETVRDFRNLLLTHTRVKNLVTEETTRIVEISRVNVEFIERAWGKTRFSPRINFAQQQLVDYTMDTQVDRTWEMAEWLNKQERGSIHMRAHLRVQSGGGRPGFDYEEHNNRDGHEPKHPPLNGYAQVVGSEEGEVVGLAAASQLRPQRKSTEAQRHGVNTVRMEDGECEARQRRLPRGFTTPSMEMAQQMHSRTELTAKLTSAAQSVTAPLMEIAKRLVKHEPVEDGWEKHAVMRALESKRVSISLMEAYLLERSGGGMMESILATAWGGGALSTEPISSHAHSARTSSGERAFEAALMMVEEVADQQSGGKSTVAEKTACGEAETERSFAIYRPGQLARQREEEEDRKRANAQRNASTAVEEASGDEAKEQPETARLDTITCELHANNTMLQCETISDGGSSHTRMNASAMEPSAAEAVVKGAGGWVDVDMVVVLANGKGSCEQQRRLRDGMVFTLRDPVTSIMAAHHAPRVYENGGEAPGLLLGGPIYHHSPRAAPGPGDQNLHFPRTQPTSRQSAAAQSNGVGAAGPRAPTCESKTCEPADLPPLRDVQSLQRHGLARLSTREEGISMYEPCGGGYVAVLNAMLANGMSKASRNALGLRDRRSRLLFHVAAFIEKLEEKQPIGVGWLLENVDTSGDERLYIKESEKYITKIIGRALVIDEAGYAYSGEGAGMLFNINTGEWERPTVHLKEELFGYEPNVIHGISLPDHERLTGNAMGLHSVAWIVGQLFVEQQRLRDLEELERAPRAAQTAQRAERERRDQRS
eukprot:jgi/Tetstr1/448484/TSEL_035752.t1